MKIRTKFTIIFLLLSLLPLTIIGIISYKNGEEAIKKNLGLTFQQMAYGTIDKIDRTLYEVYHNVQIWSELDLMQEVITDDIDTKISSFLIALNKEYGYFSDISVLDAQGRIVASSDLELIDNVFAQKDYYKNAISGKKYIEDIHLDGISNKWVITFSFPIKAKFEEDKIIGVLCANWNADELHAITQVHKDEDREKYIGHIMLIRNDGLIISAPESEKKDIFKKNLIKSGLESALLGSKKEEGYLVERDEHDRKALIGYAYSTGYHDFPSFGWVVLVDQDAKIVFAPVEKLKVIIISIWIFVALIVIIISLVVSRRMTRPIVKMSQIAARVAQGDFEGKIAYESGDETGYLIKVFNKMVQDLKEQRDQLVDKDYVESIIANAADSLIVLDLEGIIKTVNQATEKLLGYEEKELVGKSSGILFGVEGECVIFTSDRNKALIEKYPIHNYSMNYRAKNGEMIPVSFNGAIMKNKQGKVVGMVGMARDMREIKRLELQLIQAEKLNAVGQLASGVAHEVRNPLGIILQGVNYLEKKISLKEEDISEVLSMIKGSVKRADKIINSLLDFSKAHSLDLEVEDVNSILEISLGLLKAKFKFDNIDIVMETKNGIPRVFVDKNKLEQVFINILLNALQAMPSGGKIVIRTYDRTMGETRDEIERIENGHFRIGERAVIVEIEDTGPGISEETLKKIFDPFFTTKGPTGGAGLGLSVTRNIINMHKGLIDIKSQMGKGTTVTVILKIAKDNDECEKNIAY